MHRQNAFYMMLSVFRQQLKSSVQHASASDTFYMALSPIVFIVIIEAPIVSPGFAGDLEQATLQTSSPDPW